MDRDEQAAPIRPIATATIGLHPLHASNAGPFAIDILLELVERRPARPRIAETLDVARRALAAFAPAPGGADRRRFEEVVTVRRDPAGGRVPSVTGVHAEAVCNERPSSDSIGEISTVLAGAGFRVHLRERRECCQPGCAAEAVVEYGRPDEIPAGWFSAITCGKHQFRQCRKCSSVFLLTSSNAAGQAPALHCSVCDHVLVEWGGSKRWEAELVTRGGEKA